MRQNNQKQTIPPIDVFERWEVDIVRPLSITREGNRYIVVAIDYFSRWLEARPLKAANVKIIATFLYEEIIVDLEYQGYYKMTEEFISCMK